MLRVAPTRRDDLISLIYMMIFLINGDLPWLEQGTALNVERILKLKLTITPQDLCKSNAGKFL